MNYEAHDNLLRYQGCQPTAKNYEGSFTVAWWVL